MVSLGDILPPPVDRFENSYDGLSGPSPSDWWFKQHEMGGAIISTSDVKEPPPYGPARNGFVPRRKEDYGDGGAFPEIFVAQFPLDMGKSSDSGIPGGKNANTLALQVDSQGKLRFDALAKQGHGKDKVVYTQLSDMKEKELDLSEDSSLQRPSEEEIEAMTEKTREALEKITESKVSAALPVKRAEKLAPPQYIRYTPSQQGPAFNSGASQRIIRMVEEQKDPMSPPRFKVNQKIPRGPPSPPAPVLHSPTRKVTQKEQQEWKIPPCISNWKNNRGYTMPLDKRLAADGRGLQQVHINENFAKLAEALYIADRKAREAVEMRSQLERRVAQKEKEEKEERMREMARKAREERAGIKGTEKMSKEAKDREEFRQERRQERQRERNIARMAPDRRSKLAKDKDRDISEKIALGLPDAKPAGGDVQFDQRLFDTSKGLDSGGGLDDETYAVYDKPWRTGQEALGQQIYRPSKNIDQDVYGGDLEKLISTKRFVPDKGFSGADAEGSGKREGGPVQFEKDAEEEDPFGLGKFLDEAKRGHKRGGHDESNPSSSKKRK